MTEPASQPQAPPGHPGPPPPEMVFSDPPGMVTGTGPPVSLPPLTGPGADPGQPLVPVPGMPDREELQLAEPDGKWRDDFDGLLYLGALSGSFSYCGHRFSIRTLNSGEELIVAQLTQEWQGTIGELKAYSIAMCAMAVQSIDGRPMLTPLGETHDQIEWARERFVYAQRWYDPTLTEIYSRYLELENRVKEVIDGLGKASPGTGPGPNGNSGLPSAEASSTESGSP